MARALDLKAVRAEFPILSREVNGRPLVYLDNAASAQTPDAVLDSMSNQARTAYANVHRGLHTLANETTEAYEGAREKVRRFLMCSRFSLTWLSLQFRWRPPSLTINSNMLRRPCVSAHRPSRFGQLR